MSRQRNGGALCSQVLVQFLGSLKNQWKDAVGSNPYMYDYGDECLPDHNGKEFQPNHEGRRTTSYTEECVVLQFVSHKRSW